MLSVTELRGSNLSISVHNLKYIDASSCEATNLDNLNVSGREINKKDEVEAGIFL